jgi:hypothetical protein
MERKVTLTRESGINEVQKIDYISKYCQVLVTIDGVRIG